MKKLINMYSLTFIIILFLFCDSAQAYYKSNFGRHGERGGRYCLFQGGICWNSIRIGDVLLADEGFLDIEIINNSQVHFVFHRDMEISYLPDSLLPVDTITALNTEVSNSLGYESIILMEGNYDINFSNHQYGEATINAVLIGPLTKLNITVIPEGYLFAASINTTRSNIKDKSSIFLRSTTAPFSIVDIDTVEIDSITLSGVCFFNNATPGSYYVVVQHRNSMETWSSNPVSISENLTSYDFTSSSSKAYGNNMVLKFEKWCTFSGDVNQNSIIDIGDVVEIYNDVSGFAQGYVVSDLNGDYLVDLSDLVIAYGNAVNFIAVQKP
ncbi:MAG: hypothetical protein KDD00_07160 [Ignavibacteriae bacterium]|nr:hypothetical protein [Ignavibacteriota bacterium]